MARDADGWMVTAERLMRRKEIDSGVSVRGRRQAPPWIACLQFAFAGEDGQFHRGFFSGAEQDAKHRARHVSAESAVAVRVSSVFDSTFLIALLRRFLP